MIFGIFFGQEGASGAPGGNFSLLLYCFPLHHTLLPGFTRSADLNALPVPMLRQTYVEPSQARFSFLFIHILSILVTVWQSTVLVDSLAQASVVLVDSLALELQI